jgi:hypothetical protein
MQKNPRRIQFTKGLYGFYYEWDTKSGRKRQRKFGLVDNLSDFSKVGESAILVPEEDLDKLKAYFQSYSDVIIAKAFKIAHEVPLYDTKVNSMSNDNVQVDTNR